MRLLPSPPSPNRVCSRSFAAGRFAAESLTRVSSLSPTLRHVRFKFAQTNEVILIDEFDNIARDTLPFWAIPPSVLHERARVLEDAPWTFTMVIKKGEVSIAGAHKGDGRAADQAKLMKRWVKWVPITNITMSAHDGPSIMTDERMMRRHVEAAKQGLREFGLLFFCLSSARRGS